MNLVTQHITADNTHIAVNKILKHDDNMQHVQIKYFTRELTAQQIIKSETA